jgi:hypothetical protein
MIDHLVWCSAVMPRMFAAARNKLTIYLVLPPDKLASRRPRSPSAVDEVTACVIGMSFVG